MIRFRLHWYRTTDKNYILNKKRTLPKRSLHYGIMPECTCNFRSPLYSLRFRILSASCCCWQYSVPTTKAVLMRMQQQHERMYKNLLVFWNRLKIKYAALGVCTTAAHTHFVGEGSKFYWFVYYLEQSDNICTSILCNLYSTYL